MSGLLANLSNESNTNEITTITETLLTTKENIQNSARSLVTKMVNALTSKLEIGSPMASMYLLENPDHYTSHEFVSFYWRTFVREAVTRIQGACTKRTAELSV